MTTDIGGGREDSIREIALQANGKIVVVGWRNDPVRANDFALVRYNINGKLDMTFCTDGRVKVDFGSVDDGQKLVLQSDGRYVLAGSTQGDFALARVLP